LLSFDISIKESVVVKYANSNILSIDEIEITFPFIYMKQFDFYFIFELTLFDLFVKHGKNFFLVVFNKNNPTNSFFLGSIGFAGFYFGRKIYLKRKLRANKLDDEFSYDISSNININIV
jgi:hypothetical protein